MKILLTKLTDDRHQLAIERDDGSTESVELETRSFLLHDLVHYAVEAEAKIDDGFWGLLARGTKSAAPFADMDFIARVRARLRGLTGHWRATKFRDVMEVRWPPGNA